MGNYDRSRNDALNKIMAVHEQFPNASLIVYDQRKDYKMTDLYFQIGVAGHLLKKNIGIEIAAAIRAVLSGKHYLCPGLSKAVLDSFTAPNAKGILTEREAQVAKLLVQGKKTSWIASSLQRKASTISSTKQNIFRKMNVDSAVELSKVLPKS
jgi:DNA-binding NarL/FixJ family response regulator